MQKFEKNSRLLHVYDTETRQEAWLRQHAFHACSKTDIDNILGCETRGAVTPLTRREIEELLMGPDVQYDERYGLYIRKRETSVQGICYHPTKDLADTFFKPDLEAPPTAHVLWKESIDEINIQSIAVDSEFPFRKLMYLVLIDDLKLLIRTSVGCEHMEKITAKLSPNELERQFFVSQCFKVIEVPGEGKILSWIPEYERLTKENRWSEQRKHK